MNIYAKNSDIAVLYRKNSMYANDAGFDIPCPENIQVPGKAIGFKICLGIKCKYENSRSFLLFPRSSISNTPLRLANSVGVIDGGYRGEIMIKVDNLSDEPYSIKAGDRLVQIVTNTLSLPRDVIIHKSWDNIDETDRGDNGFGSTGK